MNSYPTRPAGTRRLALLLAVALAGCATARTGHPVDGELGLVPLHTTVDSSLAARFLTSPRGGSATSSPSHSADDARIAALLEKYDPLELRSDQLRALASESSTDFAAIYFARRILAEPRHQALQRRFVETIARLEAHQKTRIDDLDPAVYTFAFVPGLFYERRPETGAAMARTRALLEQRGFTTDLVPTGETSTIEEGARVLADYLVEARKSDRKLILTSASKGGGDVAHALGNLLAGEDLSHVRGWVSIGGVLRGTPLADVGLTFPSSWLLALTGWAHGTSLGVAHDLSTARSEKRAASYTFPEHLQVLHYVGVPLSGTVSDKVRGNYDTMLQFGPNDGITLLPDQLLPQGHVVLAIGADHRFVDPRADLKTLALANLIVELVEEAEAASARRGRLSR